MATEPTLEGYLKGNASVKAARKKLEAASKKLEAAKRTQAGARNAKPDVLADIKNSVETARADYDAAKSEANAVETKATNYFKTNYEKITTKANKSSLAELQAALPKAKSAEEYKAIQDSIDKIQGKITNPQPYQETTFTTIPKPGGIISGSGTSVEDNRDYAKELSSANKFIYGMSDAERSNLANVLRGAGYTNVPASGIYNDQLVAAYQQAINANKVRNDLRKSLDVPQAPQSLTDYLAEATKNQGALGGGAGTSTTDITRSFSSATDAASVINNQFQALLGRDATAIELADLTKKLNAAEKKNATVRRSSTSGTGSSSTTYTGGINQGEYIAELIKKMPEFSKKKADKAALTTQSIENTIKANGITVDPIQLKAWTDQVQNGGDIKNIENQIRAIASTGMPDNVKKLMAGGVDLATVYAPYKSTMASILELDPNAISISDPVLRNAIGANGEMPLYDFQRALRKDARWQYTNNAREEVANSVQGVLKDFGFMG